jgi:tetratricopeptide (TPR) repeat protein
MKKYILSIALLFAVTSQAHSQSEPPYGMSEIQAYSIFYENYRTGDYDMALQFGKWMLEKKPREIQGVNRFNLPRQYERMIDVYVQLSERETDPSTSSALLDSALVIYEDAFETFDEEEIDLYRWHFNRGRFYQEHQGQIRDGLDKAYAEYMKAYELDAERLIQAADGYYIQILLSNYVSNNQRDEALAMIEAVEPLAGSALSQVLDDTRDGLFSDPTERVEFLEARLADNPGDESIIRELASMYENMGNRAKAIEFAEKLYEIEPNFTNLRRLADYAKADGQNQKAITYLRDALEMDGDTDRKKRINLEIAELYQNEGNLQNARQYARAAISLDSSWGQPYIRMARIYASAISQCTQGRQIERDDRAVYWLVLDYLDRARNADPSVATAVSRDYRTYEPVMPTSEDKFFRGWETGDSFQIGSNLSQCYAWINETTTVR